MHFASADGGAHHAVVETFRSSIAPYAGGTACFLGVQVLLDSLISYVDPHDKIAPTDDIFFATWI
jgi:hypothetical protein